MTHQIALLAHVCNVHHLNDRAFFLFLFLCLMSIYLDSAQKLHVPVDAFVLHERDSAFMQVTYVLYSR